MRINIDELKKVELKVAKVVKTERVEGSEKLIILQLTLGNEDRQIVAGIGKAYTPEELVGREIIIVANLESRTLMGLESQGMLLAAKGEDGLPALLMPEREVPPGSAVG